MDFTDSEEDLLPTDSGIVAAFGKFRPGARLLENEPPYSEDDPIYFY